MAEDFDVTELTRGLNDIVSLRPGEFLFFEGDEADCFYIVKSGTLRVVQGDAILETLRTGSIVGEMALIDEHRRSASVIAGNHAELYRLDEARFLSLVEQRPRFALIVMRVLSNRLRIMNERYRVKAAEQSASRRKKSNA